jgi:hypothetical protein
VRVDLKGVEILLEKERSVGCVLGIDFGKKVFFRVSIETELFHGLIFGDVSDTILKLWTVNDTLQIRPDCNVFLNTHLIKDKFVSGVNVILITQCLELFILRLA